ncbi:hypothetical protein [Nitrospira calida]|jgi:hypothetical protein
MTMRRPRQNVLFAFAFAAAAHSLAFAAQSPISTGRGTLAELPDFEQVVRSHADALAAVNSDAEAQAVFVTTIGSALGLNDVIGALSTKRLARKPFAESVYQELSRTSTRLIAELAVWRAAVSALQAAIEPSRWRTLEQELSQQQAWIVQTTGRQALGSLVAVAQVLAAFPLTEDHTGLVPGRFSDYAAQLDQRFPALVGPSSWLSLAEQHGIAAIRERLWDVPAIRDREPAEQQALAARYVESRLRPVLLTHLRALAGLAQAEASRSVFDQWLRLRLWKETVREQRGLARLCGTWQWTIHNHQNHHEQKLSLVFPPPGSTAGNGPRPAEVVVLGDAVYLRWESGGHLQEDSLLFSKEDQRLEGTFVNTAGGWGSISGKRTAGCSAR